MMLLEKWAVRLRFGEVKVEYPREEKFGEYATPAAWNWPDIPQTSL
jgi:hypothetical protein